MRDALRKLGEYPDHRGLAHDVWAPVGIMPARDDSTTDRPGKLDIEQHPRWLASLTRSGQPDHYDLALARWKRSFAGPEHLLFHSRTGSRLLVGHGNRSPTDVGITLHHTWGVPVIPGTALEGLLAHYIEANLGPGDGPGDEDDQDPVRRRFAGPARDPGGDNVTGPPGDLYGRLFGVPPLRDHGGAQLACRGELVVHDALWDWAPRDTRDEPAANAPPMLAPDVLTVHQKRYYDSGGETGPSDWDSPVPISFLSVPPGARFVFALHCADAKLLERAAHYLRAALREWGVGGKTAAGYGRFEHFERARQTPRRAQAPVLTDLQTYLEQQKRQGIVQRLILEQIETDWLERLRQLPASQHDDVRRLLAKYIKSSKLTDRRDRLLQAIAGAGL